MKQITSFLTNPLLGLLLAGVVLAGCNGIDEPVTSTQDSLQSTADTVEGTDGEETDEQSHQQIAESLVVRASANQSAMVLEWNDDAKLSYTIVRADNLDCKPLTSENCQNELRIPGVSGNRYVDENIEQGSVYYYWLIVAVPATAHAASAADLPSQNAAKPVVSKARRVALSITDDLDNLIPERPGTRFPQDLQFASSGGYVRLDWEYKRDFNVTVYAGSNPACDLAPLVQGTTVDKSTSAEPANCAREVANSSTSPMHMEVSKFANMPYVWAVVTNKGITDKKLSSDSHRLVGPYKLTIQKSVNSTSPSVRLIEQTQHGEHNITIAFPESTKYLDNSLNYTLVIINSLQPLDLALVQQMLDRLHADNKEPLTGKEISSMLRSLGRVQAKVLKADNFARTGDMLSYKIHVRPSSWYNVLLIAGDSISTENYLPSTMRTANHINIRVKGQYGLWQVHYNDRIQLALRSSGYFYPGLLDWRKLRIDAKLAMKDKLSYSFTGCLFYASTSGIGEALLSDNVCLFAQTVEGKLLSSPHITPLPITMKVEPRTTSTACTDFTRIENTDYQRSRYFQATNTSKLLCDHRNVSSSNDNSPNYYAFVQPHNAPGEMARGKVEMWHAGTQAPVFIDPENATLPSLPDQHLPVIACADYTPEGSQCDWSAPIEVARCNGYFVYRLVKVPGCSMAYSLEEDEISATHRLGH